MASSSIQLGPGETVPEGYAAVPINQEQQVASLRVCVLFRTEPEPAVGHFVVVRELPGGRALLGCVTDACDVVHEWIELWVQDIGGFAGSPEAVGNVLSNALLDQRWTDSFRAAQTIQPGFVLATGCETNHPRPTYIDGQNCTPVHLRDPDTQQPLELCEDDALLSRKSLPAYRSSMHRYLHVPARGESSPFVPVSEEAPRTPSTIELDELIPEAEGLVALNGDGGLLQARRYSPVQLEALVELLGGASWQGVFHGATAMTLGEPLRGLSQSSTLERMAEASLVLGKGGRTGRLLEVLHLKLRMLADAIEATHSHVRLTERPLLNIAPDSFQVHLGSPGCGLPYLWTANVCLARPGEAIPLPIEGSRLVYYLPGRGDRTSIFRRASGRVPTQGVGVVRLRQVLTEASRSLIAEGTLATHERLEMSANDLIWMRVPVAAGSVNLYARVDEAQALATGEVRFRSVAQELDASVSRQVKEYEGIPIERVVFQVVPLLSTPQDLYSLAVLAVRILLTQPAQSLPIALDEMLSLARQVAAEYAAEEALAARIARIMGDDPRWAESLGPHRLVHEPVPVREAFAYIPEDLWFGTLAAVIRMFPGMGPDSICADLGDAPEAAPHRVFDTVRDDLADLLLRSRSLLFVDWAANREVHAVIRERMVGIHEPWAGAGEAR